MYFASDNTAGIAPPILEAIGRANTGYALGYGNDDCTKRVEQRFADIFEKDVAVFLVPTGTVANALALAHLHAALGRGAVPCGFAHRDRRMRCAGVLRRRHQADRPERRGRQDFRRHIARGARARRVGRAASRHARSVLSLSQATRERHDLSRRRDHGTCRDRACARTGGARGRRAARQCARAHECLAGRSHLEGRVDVLSFGATKGGAMGAEAVIFFDPRARRRHAGAGASAAVRSPPSIASSRRRWRRIWRRRSVAQARAPRQRRWRMR